MSILVVSRNLSQLPLISAVILSKPLLAYFLCSNGVNHLKRHCLPLGFDVVISSSRSFARLVSEIQKEANCLLGLFDLPIILALCYVVDIKINFIRFDI